MKRAALAVILLAGVTLAGCGADGDPIRPTFTGGVSVGSSGVNTYGGVAATKGPFSIIVGL